MTDRKPLDKKLIESWSCEHGCPETKKPCKHLEELLPHPLHGDRTRAPLRMGFYSDMDSIIDSDAYQALTTHLNPEKIGRFITLLRKYQLKQYEIELLVDRFCYGKSFETIAKERSYTGVGAVYSVYSHALEALRERGLSWEGLQK